MSFKTRSSKMSRNLSRHSGVSCDACGKGSFGGKRYKCLVCYDFDLCTDCYEAGEVGTGRHTTQHPMQCILTRVDTDLFFGGESSHSTENTSFTCPMCGQLGFSEAQLREHVTKQHSDPGTLQEVICPVCAAHPSGDPNHLTDDLPTHLTMEHRALRDMEQDPNVVQSRVRRLIGRRRAGLDRYAGVIAREPHDNVDPITELLSQLSGGGGAGSRRIVPEVPAHIQQLLEQQERQALERGSPLRRPIYRKVIASGSSEGGTLSIEPTAAYLVPGSGTAGLFHAHQLLKVDTEPLPRSFLNDDAKDEQVENTTVGNNSNSLLPNYSVPKLSEQEQVSLECQRADRSLFVQELLLSTLVCSDSSSSNSDTSDREDT